MKRALSLLTGAAFAALPTVALADAITGGGAKSTTNWSAIGMFVLFVLVTLFLPKGILGLIDQLKRKTRPSEPKNDFAEEGAGANASQG